MADQVVVFRVGPEEYAISISKVREIIKSAEVHQVPHAPAYMLGLINVRGTAIPLIDLYTRFGVRRQSGLPEENKEPGLILIVEIQDDIVGFSVDQVLEIRTLEGLMPPPPLVQAPFIGGVVNLESRIIMQVIPENIMADAELEVIRSLG